ncbi:MAG: flavin-containing monooxygenase [Flavobacteriaceae bacterium]
MKRVCVIGAGPSGITAIKNILAQGIAVKAYDFNADVGGNWIYNESESHSSVFETTHIISSKSLSEYADFPFDPSVADYPSHTDLRNYFQAYARHFDLYPHIAFQTLVESCRRLEDGQWEVRTSCQGKQNTERFTDLVVCNGHHWQPNYPSYPGKFTGQFLHAHQYKKAAPFEGEKVLVIGGGNSACDVAVETSRVSTKTAISWRRGYRILPKFIMGKPSDVIAAGMTFLPVGLRNFLAGIMIKIATGPNRWYGLPRVAHKFGATHPTVNSELLYKIRHGKVAPKPDIERFVGKTVHFTDGTQEEFDTVVACTGYVLAHPFFDTAVIDYREGPVPLYLKMFHPKFDNLFFIGMFQPLGCIWPGAEQQSKLAALALTGQWQRPKDIEARCQREVTHPHMRQINTSRHRITVDFHKFIRDIKTQIRKASFHKKVA